MTQLHELSALAQGEAIRKGEISSQELVDHYLARIEKHDFGAFVTVTKGERPTGSGPLWGVPTAIKDNVATAGVRSTFGSKVYENFVPAVDAHVVTLIREAGLISLGKTTTPEFGLSAYSDAQNPWDITKTAGGSSGGAAAAVAAGLIPLAHANDGGGSIRIPASMCGVFGLKTSRGRVSPGPMGVDLFGLTVQGPIARTVADAAALLDAMAKPMPGDPHWAPPPAESFLEATRRDPGRMRIACYGEGVEQTRQLLLDLGHEVEEIKDPFPEEVIGIFITLWATQSLRFRVPPEAEESLRPITRWWRERGRATSAATLVDAMADAQVIARRVVTELDSFDAVLNPTLAMPPVPKSWFTETGDPEEEIERQRIFSPFTGGANLTGQPSASLPLHWTPDGLPIGSMVTGRPAGEAQLLSLCAQLERARPWSHRWPSP